MKFAAVVFLALAGLAAAAKREPDWWLAVGGGARAWGVRGAG